MPTYKFEALDTTGGEVKDSVSALSEEEAQQKIKQMGYFVTKIIEVAGNMPVLIDSGFRRGTDILKALCMGAKGVAVGRPYLWGLGAFGTAGVDRALELLRIELLAAMQQIGAPSLKDLKPSMVVKA